MLELFRCFRHDLKTSYVPRVVAEIEIRRGTTHATDICSRVRGHRTRFVEHLGHANNGFALQPPMRGRKLGQLG